MYSKGMSKTFGVRVIYRKIRYFVAYIRYLTKSYISVRGYCKYSCNFFPIQVQSPPEIWIPG
jgi:hypothetical protein